MLAVQVKSKRAEVVCQKLACSHAQLFMIPCSLTELGYGVAGMFTAYKNLQRW